MVESASVKGSFSESIPWAAVRTEFMTDSRTSIKRIPLRSWYDKVQWRAWHWEKGYQYSARLAGLTKRVSLKAITYLSSTGDFIRLMSSLKMKTTLI